MSKKKVAVIFGYNGANFFGSQIQPGSCRTVEGELESALYQAGLISEANHGNLHKIGWSRASRTDRGVHAKTTVVALKLQWTGGPSASLPALINTHTPSDMHVFAIKEVTGSFNAHGKANYREYEYVFPAKILFPTDFTLANIDQINTLTSKFIGTKNYHNYTRKLTYEKAESRRYIVKFEANKELLTHNSVSFLRFSITGQSFLYHQIRSMIGAVLSVITGFWQENEIENSFLEGKKKVPIAPAEGLFLSQVLYTGYNRKQPQKAVNLTESEENEVKKFYLESILPEIAGKLSVFEGWRPESDVISENEGENQSENSP